MSVPKAGRRPKVKETRLVMAFPQEQDRTPWTRALKASLLASALALDPQLRVSDLKMVSHFVVRKVHLEARAGPARTLVVPAVPLPFIETVLRYCHSDIFSAHLGKTKTADKRFQGRCTRPYADDVPEGVGDDPTEDGTGPLTEEDLPSTTFVERLSIGETFWLSRAALAPEYGALIRAFEDADREKRDLPELRRNVRLIEANADVDDAEVLL
ncbi:hypothetical protein PC110_g21427 [Phytophthora cactorum]|uniref:Uncharacterized protein n=1 Tax=Phytophthora cactorum TaxID=29920 RepID=A0A329RC27_9STRA|nr:hypothetical protein PC110_g21427 [Phytophthora cactorum]